MAEQLKTYYTFDDVALIPQYSNVNSRLDTKLNTKLTKKITMKIPIVAANMDTVICERMAYIFDTRRVQMSGLACELVVPEEWQKSVDDEVMKEQFVRSPYAVSFKSNNQTFIL